MLKVPPVRFRPAPATTRVVYRAWYASPWRTWGRLFTLAGKPVAHLFMRAHFRELRRTLVRSRLEAKYHEVYDSVVDYLADRPADSIRAVNGLVQRVVRAAQAEDREPDLAFVSALMEGAISLDVPLVADWGVGHSWYDAKG